MAPTLGEKKNSCPRGDCFTQRLSGFNDKTDRIESDKGKKDLRKKFWANKVGSSQYPYRWQARIDIPLLRPIGSRLLKMINLG